MVRQEGWWPNHYALRLIEFIDGGSADGEENKLKKSVF